VTTPEKQKKPHPILAGLTERSVRVPLRSTTGRGVIDELVCLLHEQGLVADKDRVLNDVTAREEEKSTGLEKGVAVPHARTPGVRELALAVGVSPEGIDFGAIDGLASRIFFLILSPPDAPELHIRALQEIAFLVSDERFRTALLDAQTPAGIMAVVREHLRNS
jgi:PTS system fructose-specific IIC component/PTS system nitrogen regulatory IIA component